MTNELALLALLFIYGRSEGRFNLPFVILCYYAVYLALESYPAGISEQAGWLEFYLRQSALDVLAILACCYISTFYNKFSRLSLYYAVIISTSQLLQLAMIFDPVQFADLYELRQLSAIPIDLAFATLGSGFGAYLLRFAYGLRAAYNKFYPNSNNGGTDK